MKGHRLPFLLTATAVFAVFAVGLTGTGTFESGFGLQLDDFSDGRQTETIDPTAGRLTLAASGGGAAFVWAKKCLGLFETVCSYTLHRIALRSGADQTLAVMDASADDPGLVAISASGNRLVIANREGIFVRDLTGL